MSRMLIECAASRAWYHRTISQLFAATCASRPHKAAIVYADGEMSYDELWRQVQQVAQGLLNLGIGRGDVVSTLPSPTPQFAVLYFATLQIGAVVNPLNLLWGTHELRGVLARNAPAMIATVDRYGGRDVLAWLEEALPSLPSLKHKVCVRRHSTRAPGFLEFADLLEAGAQVDARRMAALVEAGRPTDVQFICQTSGTTGLSKSAMWTHRPPLATVFFAARHLGYSEDERYLNLAPFFHNSGLFALNLNLALAGSTLYLMDGFEAADALELALRHGITATFSFDAHWQGLRRVPGFGNRRLPIRKAVLAGEPRTYDLVRAMCGDAAVIVNLYAQTENGPLVSLGEHDCVDERLNRDTHGRPLPGVEVVIKHPDTGERMRQGEAGEICYRSPYLFSGYLAQPEATQAARDAEGYFRSGDYGHLDGGYITFLGRLGGVVKSGGENVSTLRVTNLLLDLFSDDFDDAKTIGVADDYWGAKVVSFVRMRGGRPLPPTPTLRQACKGRLAAFEVPREFLAWEGEWPVSAEGKIDFRRLQAEAVARSASRSGPEVCPSGAGSCTE